jgi:hypothetical protein
MARIFYRGDAEVPERDDRSDDRRRPAGPAWATVPTMAWNRVLPGQRDDQDSREERDTGEQPRVRPRRPEGEDEHPVPVSPAIVLGPPLPRGTARPAPPMPAPEPTVPEPAAVVPTRGARQILGPPGMPPAVLHPDLADLLVAPTPPGGMPIVESIVTALPADEPEQPAGPASPDPEQILMG